MADTLQYPSLKCAFDTLIGGKGIPVHGRIHYLKKYLDGEAKEAVEGFLFVPSEESYDQARSLLHDRYGNQFVDANAFRDKLEKWPRIHPKYGEGLRKFSDFLQQCVSAMNSIECLSVLNDDRQNKEILCKLPDWLIGRWARIVTDWRDET